MGDLLKGMTVLAYTEDPVAAAKVCEAYAKGNDKFAILGGAMGDTILDTAGVKAVAAMPSREELLAQIVSCIGAPASAIVISTSSICNPDMCANVTWKLMSHTLTK